MSLAETPQPGNRPEDEHFSEADFAALLTLGDASEVARQAEQSLARVYDEIARIEMLAGGSYHEVTHDDSTQMVLFLTRRQRNQRLNHTYFHVVVNDWLQPEGQSARLISREFVVPRHYRAIGYSRNTVIYPDSRRRYRAGAETGPVLRRQWDQVDILTAPEHQVAWPELKKNVDISDQNASILLADELTSILGRLNTYTFEPQVELARPLDKL